MKIHFLILSLGILLCGAAKAQADPSKNVVKVGVIAPLTGPAAELLDDPRIRQAYLGL